MTDASSSNKAIQRSGVEYIDIHYRWNAFNRFISGRAFSIVPIVCAILMLVVPGFSVLMLSTFGIFFWYLKGSNVALPLRAPINGPQRTTNDIDASGNYRKAKGVSYYGICRDTRRRVYSDSDLDRQHRILVGTTGSGKTVGIIALNVNTLIMGGGAFMLDGKGDKDFIYDYIAFSRRFLRTPCLFILDFATSRDIYERSTDFISNQLNLPSQGSSGVLAEITKATADDGEGDIWSQRKDQWIELAYRLLFFFQDRHGEVATMSSFSKYLDLRYFIDRYLDPRIVKDPGGRVVLAQCTDFISTLPGLEANQLDKIHSNEQQLTQTTLDQWGYVVMSVAPALSLMTRQYWHIFDTRALADIDFEDAFIGDRLAFGLLPALQKSESAMRSLGKLIVGLMQAMYGKIMPQDLVGERKNLKDIRATLSPYYYQVFYDEAGYYLSSGSDKQQAQLRSLQVSITVACQNYGQLEKSGDDVAEGTWGSSNIKIVGKIEDSGKTLDKVNSRLGTIEKWVIDERGIEYTSSGRSRFLSPTRVTRKESNVISIDKLASMVEGQFIMVVGGNTVINLKTPNFKAPRLDVLRPNIYMPMNKPKVERESPEFVDFKNHLKRLIASKDQQGYSQEYIRDDYDLRSIVGHLDSYNRKTKFESGLCAIYKHVDDSFKNDDASLKMSQQLASILASVQDTEAETETEYQADLDVGQKDNHDHDEMAYYDDYPEAAVEHDNSTASVYSSDESHDDSPSVEQEEIAGETIDHATMVNDILGSLSLDDDSDDTDQNGQMGLALDVPSNAIYKPAKPASATRAVREANITAPAILESERVSVDDLEQRDDSGVSLSDLLSDTLGNEEDPLLVAADLAGVKSQIEDLAVQNSEEDQTPVDITSAESREFLEQLAKSIDGPDVVVDIRLPSYKKNK